MRAGRVTELDLWWTESMPAASQRPAPKEEFITIPTTALQMEAQLGQCDALEGYLVRHRELDIKQREIEGEALRPAHLTGVSGSTGDSTEPAASVEKVRSEVLPAQPSASRLAARLQDDRQCRKPETCPFLSITGTKQSLRR
jgi:hypothetical protein